MKRLYPNFSFAVIVMITLGCTIAGCQEPAAPPKADLAAFKLIRPILETHCFVCHGEKKQENDLDLTKLDPDVIRGADAEEWQDVVPANFKKKFLPFCRREC